MLLARHPLALDKSSGSVLDMNRIPPGLFENIDFVNTLCPYTGLSVINTSKGDKSQGGDAIQNHWMVESAMFVLSKIKPSYFGGKKAPSL